MKKIILASVAAASIGLATMSFADGGLTINNQSNEDSTMKINGGDCTGKLPLGLGITKKKSTKNYPLFIINTKQFCNNHNPCEAELFSGDNCEHGIGTGSIAIANGTATITSIQLAAHATIVATGQGTSTLTLADKPS